MEPSRPLPDPKSVGSWTGGGGGTCEQKPVESVGMEKWGRQGQEGLCLRADERQVEEQRGRTAQTVPDAEEGSEQLSEVCTEQSGPGRPKVLEPEHSWGPLIPLGE